MTYSHLPSRISLLHDLCVNSWVMSLKCFMKMRKSASLNVFLCACFQMRHRNSWRSWQTGNLFRCQISTTTCLISSTMRAACTPQCRLVLAALEVRSAYLHCRFSLMFLIYKAFCFVLFFSAMCIACLSCISTANPPEILITPERKSSLNKFSLFD